MFFQCGVGTLNLSPSEFWTLTLGEFWALYDSKFPPKKPEVDRDEVLKQFEEYESKYGNG